MSKYRFAALILFSCTPLLAGCSTVTDGSTQQVTFKTIGADDAYCDIQTGVNDYRYNVRPPQTVWVQRTRKPMFVSCTAPGNRMQNITVESHLAGKTFLNTLNAGLGFGVDGPTGAMFSYPDEVVIDFTTSLARDNPLPSYENKGALDARAQGIEDLGPDTPRLEGDKALADRYSKAYAEAARIDAEEAANAAEKERRMNEVEGGFYGDKGTAKPAPKTNTLKSVDIAPMSEAVPSPQAPSSNAGLTQPIFPSSTSF